MPHLETQEGFVEPQPLDPLPDQSQAQQGPAAALNVDPDPKPERTLTRYQISLGLHETDSVAAGTIAWLPLGVVDAANGKDAIRRWYDANGADERSNAYQAVPARNVTHVTVQVAQVEQVKFT